MKYYLPEDLGLRGRRLYLKEYGLEHVSGSQEWRAREEGISNAKEKGVMAD